MPDGQVVWRQRVNALLGNPGALLRLSAFVVAFIWMAQMVMDIQAFGRGGVASVWSGFTNDLFTTVAALGVVMGFIAILDASRGKRPTPLSGVPLRGRIGVVLSEPVHILALAVYAVPIVGLLHIRTAQLVSEDQIILDHPQRPGPELVLRLPDAPGLEGHGNGMIGPNI